jgi:hypothetical protein
LKKNNKFRYIEYPNAISVRPLRNIFIKDFYANKVQIQKYKDILKAPLSPLVEEELNNVQGYLRELINHADMPLNQFADEFLGDFTYEMLINEEYLYKDQLIEQMDDIRSRIRALFKEIGEQCFTNNQKTLFRLMFEDGYTQTESAKIMNKHTSYITNMLNGTQSKSYGIVLKLRKYLIQDPYKSKIDYLVSDLAKVRKKLENL